LLGGKLKQKPAPFGRKMGEVPNFNLWKNARKLKEKKKNNFEDQDSKDKGRGRGKGRLEPSQLRGLNNPGSIKTVMNYERTSLGLGKKGTFQGKGKTFTGRARTKGNFIEGSASLK